EGVTAEQDRALMSGDVMYATLNAQKKLEKVEVRGNAYLKSMEEKKAAEVHSTDMDFFLDKDQRLERAVAMNQTRARTLDADSDVEIAGPNVLEVLFDTQTERSVLKQ